MFSREGRQKRAEGGRHLVTLLQKLRYLSRTYGNDQTRSRYSSILPDRNRRTA